MTEEELEKWLEMMPSTPELCSICEKEVPVLKQDEHALLVCLDC